MFDKKEYMNEWYKNHPEYNKRYHIIHHEKINERSRRWRENNIERMKKSKKDWCENNREKDNERKKQWAKNNPIERKETTKKYNENNSEKRKEAVKCSRKKNIVRYREYQKKWKNNKYKTDLKFNLSKKISNMMRQSLKKNKLGKHWETFLDYTLNDLIRRLKETIPAGYTWQDFLSGKLHIDHKIPISAFNFIRPEHTDFKRCWALNNLRLLSAKENLIKNARLNRPFQPALRI